MARGSPPNTLEVRDLVKVIGDAEAPGPITWATYAGHRFAQELDRPDIGDALPFRHEVTALSAS